MKQLILGSRFEPLLRATFADLQAKYSGTYLGFLWFIISPLILLIVYSIVYLHIFKLQPSDGGIQQNLLHIFTGLIPFWAFAEGMTVGAGSIINNKSLMNNTTFSFEYFPMKSVLASQLPLIFSLTTGVDGGFG